MRSTSDGRPLSNLDSEAPPGEIIDGHTCPGCNGVPAMPPLPLPRECRDTLADRVKAPTEPSESGYDPVRRPAHYARLRPEPLEVIEAWGLGFHLGNVVKYIARAGHKGSEVEDLDKARQYLERRIAMLRRRQA